MKSKSHRSRWRGTAEPSVVGAMMDGRDESTMQYLTGRGWMTVSSGENSLRFPNRNRRLHYLVLCSRRARALNWAASASASRLIRSAACRPR